MLDAGEDKVAINTHSILNENLIYQASRIFGSQCIVLEIQTKKLKRAIGKHIQKVAGKDIN